LPIRLLLSRLTGAGALALLLPLAARAENPGLPDGLYAQISTPRGTITCELEYRRAPLTVANFVGLAEGTLGPAPRKPFFDGLTFHRVVPGFVIQGGDPLGTGDGGPGYSFPDEFAPALSHGSAGVLSMANDGPDTNGSQFFITLAPAGRLDYLHAVFGRTVSGTDVLGRVAQGDAMKVRIIRIGAAARGFRADDSAFASLAAAVPRYTSEREPGPAAHFDDAARLLPADPPRARLFNFKLANFQRATGIGIYARVLPSMPPGAADPEELAMQLARSLGRVDCSLLAVYLADRGAWGLWVSDALAVRLAGSGADPREIRANGSLARAITAIDAESRRRADAFLTKAKSDLPNFLQSQGQQIKASMDGMLDIIIEKLSTQKPLT
jgi:cyclophilin family peptidyl-prolyl cis-trans isomerase